MDDYEIMGRIGEGAHGIVLKAKNLQTGNVVAMKKVALKKLEEGISNQAFREIKALQEFDHTHVIKLLEVFPHSNGFCLVFEHMTTDLGELIRDWDTPLETPLVKSYLRQLLHGVAYLHENSIMHRDLKPANLLISNEGLLKIADFGLARLFFREEGAARPYSHQVATRWYRAPELLYGARHYDEGVDLWAVGCIFGEMLNYSPLFPGENDIEQLVCVFRRLGTPNVETWPGVTQLPDYHKITFPEYPAQQFEEIVPEAEPVAVRLLARFLVYDFTKRINAKEALMDTYFFTNPLPTPIDFLPVPKAKDTKASAHMLELDVAQPIESYLPFIPDM